MSDMMVHWAAFEDLRRLMAADSNMAPQLVNVINTERESGRLGALSRGASVWCSDLLHLARDNWGGGTDRRLRQKLAFALGGIIHYPADIVMKPMMHQKAAESWKLEHPEEEATHSPSIREVSAYYDTHVFRKVYQDGHEDPFNDFLFIFSPNETTPGRALEEFVRALFQRALLSSHTLAPDKGNIDCWSDRLFDLLQPLYISNELYADVFTHPDSGKMALYEVETAFYREDDPAIIVARNAHAQKHVDEEELEAAVASGANCSAYGRILEIGMARLRDASAFWEGETDLVPDLAQ